MLQNVLFDFAVIDQTLVVVCAVISEVVNSAFPIQIIREDVSETTF